MTTPGIAITARNKMTIPDIDDWGEIDNEDVRYAFEQFYGKSNDDTQELFKKNIIERCDNLRFMPIKPFKYYIFGLSNYVECNISSDNADAASCFIELVCDRLASNYADMLDIMTELLLSLEIVAREQKNFGADYDIYGDFIDILDRIRSLLKITKTA